MLIRNNPFATASDSDTPFSALAQAAASPLPQSFPWERVTVTVGFDAQLDKVQALLDRLAPPAPTPAPLPEPAPEVPMTIAEVAIALSIAATPTPAPAPALVTIAEPAPLPAPGPDFLPTAPTPDPAYDAFANLFRGIEDRDLLADFQATLSPDSPWQGAFGGPLG